MPRRFNDSIDLSFNELLNVRAQNLGADPGTGVQPGRVYYSTALNALRLRTSDSWVSLGVAGEGLSQEQVEDIVGLMVGGTETGLTVTYNDTAGTLEFNVSITSAAVTDFTEAAQDAAGGLLGSGTRTGITVTYDDANGEIDFAVTDSPLLGGQNSAYHLSRANHTGTQLASTISDFTEAVQDVTGGSLTTSSTITWTYDDTAGTATGAVTNSPALNGQPGSHYLARANHTGTQTASTISDFEEAAQDAVSVGFANGTQSGATVSYNDASNSLSITVTNAPLLQGQNSAYHLARANHTGTQTAATISDFDTVARGLISVTDSSTLDLTYTAGTGVITGAVLNSPLLGGQNSAYHLARANHTGTQTAATISDFAEAVSDQVGTMITGNTESGITVTYDDTDNTVDLTVTDSPLLGGQNSAYHLARGNHTGTQTAATISDFNSVARGLFSVTDSATLDLTYTAGTGVFTGAVLDSPLLGGQNGAYYRARANHTGTQAASTISDFDTQVRTSRLDQMAAPTAAVSMNSQLLTNVATPVGGNDAANKDYVDSVASGLDVKASVRVASTANVASLGAQGSRTIDGVSLSAGNRVLLKDQSTASQNGIYVVGGDFSLTRAPDANTDGEVNSGMFTFVEEGTNADAGFVLTTDNPITLGTTALTFAQFSGAGQITAGAGMTKTGNTLDVGGGTGIAVTADGIAIDRTSNPRTGMVYAAALAGGATSEVVTHNLGTQDVGVSIYLSSGSYAEEEFTVEHTSTNTITIRQGGGGNIPAATYRVVVFG